MFVFPLVATLIATPAAPLPQEDPILVGADSDKHFAFDWDGRYADGTEGAVVEAMEFRYTSTTSATTKVVRIDLPVVAGETKVPVRTALVGVAEGVYDAQVRLIDPSGNAGDFSPVLSVQIQVKKASRPTGLRVVGLGSSSSSGSWTGGSIGGMTSLSPRLSSVLFGLAAELQ